MIQNFVLLDHRRLKNDISKSQKLDKVHIRYIGQKFFQFPREYFHL